MTFAGQNNPQDPLFVLNMSCGIFIAGLLNTAVGPQSGSLCLKVHQVNRQSRKLNFKSAVVMFTTSS